MSRFSGVFLAWAHGFRRKTHTSTIHVSPVQTLESIQTVATHRRNLWSIKVENHEILPDNNKGEIANSLRIVMRQIPSAVTVVTAKSNHSDSRGLTIGSFTTVSTHPPLVSFNVSQKSRMHEVLEGCSSLIIHILSSGQQDIATRFALPNLTPEEQFTGIQLENRENWPPLISNTLAAFHCLPHAMYPAGDHSIVLAEVTDISFHIGTESLSGGSNEFEKKTSVDVHQNHSLNIEHAHSTRASNDALHTHDTGEISRGLNERRNVHSSSKSEEDKTQLDKLEKEENNEQLSTPLLYLDRRFASIKELKIENISKDSLSKQIRDHDQE